MSLSKLVGLMMHLIIDKIYSNFYINDNVGEEAIFDVPNTNTTPLGQVSNDDSISPFQSLLLRKKEYINRKTIYKSESTISRVEITYHQNHSSSTYPNMVC